MGGAVGKTKKGISDADAEFAATAEKRPPDYSDAQRPTEIDLVVADAHHPEWEENDVFVFSAPTGADQAVQAHNKNKHSFHFVSAEQSDTKTLHLGLKCFLYQFFGRYIYNNP